jgi:two-component system NtrC family sensor kinase
MEAPMAKSPANRILVVDDEPEMCRLLTDVLSEEGYQVASSTDPRAALKQVYHDPPDMVITDLKMPHADGLSLVRKIREKDNDIVIIMVTAYASLETSLEGLRAGIYDYLPKPLDMDLLRASVRRGLEVQRLRRENQRLLTDLTAANQQLTETLDELKRTQAMLLQSGQMASLGMLVAGVAHELNNPISFVYGNLKHLGQYVRNLLALLAAYEAAAAHLPEAQRRQIERLAEEVELDYIRGDLDKLLQSCLAGAERAGNIVRDLRIFSRADKGEVRQIDLTEEVDAALNILHNRLKHGVAVKKTLVDLPPMTCYAGQVGQLLLNLLNNAAQAVDPKRGRIWITTEREGNTVVITVRDNGPGIPPEHLDHIFDPFFTTKPVGQGTGLGLSICYGIVQQHGGQISAASKPRKGTTVTVRLPLSVTPKSDEE